MSTLENARLEISKHFKGYNDLSFLTNGEDTYGKTPQDHSDHINVINTGQDEGYLFFDLSEDIKAPFEGDVLIDLVEYKQATKGKWKARALNDEEIYKLLTEAKTDWIKWGICKRIIECDNITYEQRFKLLSDLPKEPKKDKDKFWLRDIALLQAVKIAKEYDLQAYNNSEDNQKTTACDLISDILINEFHIAKLSSSKVQSAIKGKSLIKLV